MAHQPDWVEPMLATLTDRRFSDPDWLYERKLDGQRALAFCASGRVRLLSRNQLGLNETYPEVVEALAAQRVDCIADGEIVAFDDAQTSFAMLQARIGLHDARRARASGVEVFYYVFDMLFFDGHDLRSLSLRDRKPVLRDALSYADPLRLLAYRVGEGEEYYRTACEKGWEGVIAKRGSGRYGAGRSKEWLKFKCVTSQEFVIGGYTEPKGSREEFGALLVGYYEGDEFRYAGKVGTGYSHRTLRELGHALRAIETDRPPFADTSAIDRRGAHWVEPRMVAQIGFTEWTRDNLLRQPRYQGLRKDKAPREVVREQPR